MPIPKTLVTEYFQVILNRQFVEAERKLELIKQKMQKNDWNRGYFRALYGMYLSRKTSSDNYSFFSKLDLTDKVKLREYKKEFLEHMNNGLHGDFDKGYFSAWSDCMRILERIDVPNPNAGKNGDVDKGKPLETLRSDKSQVTMANFFQGKEK
jgi:hypothetical protein